MFKKLVSSAIMTSIVALTIPLAVTTAEAHPGCRYHRARRTVSRHTTYRRTASPYTNYANNGYSETSGTQYYSTSSGRTYTEAKKPGFYSRHRRLVNTGGGALAGAILGGLLGGKRGAGIGILAGGAGSQIFTHYQRPRNYTRVRY